MEVCVDNGAHSSKEMAPPLRHNSMIVRKHGAVRAKRSSPGHALSVQHTSDCS